MLAPIYFVMCVFIIILLFNVYACGCYYHNVLIPRQRGNQGLARRHGLDLKFKLRIHRSVCRGDKRTMDRSGLLLHTIPTCGLLLHAT
jgi:hypothetical protein